MKLFDILQQFKNIEPEAQFSTRSKREILLAPQSAPRVRRSMHVLLHVFETSAAVVLAGLFILVLTGNFFNAPAVSPIQYAVIDPTGLHAEAQAIDMQIQLANIDYPQATSQAPTQAMPASTIATGTQMKPMALALPVSTAATSTVMQTATTTSTSTPSASSSSITIDQALQQLTQ